MTRPSDSTPSSEAEIVAQLRAAGVASGGILLVHASYRAVGPVEGGPLGLIAALRAALGFDGTLVMPCWTGDADAPFDAATTPASPDLGIVPEFFRTLPGVLRSTHPFAFAAQGPAAAAIVADALPVPPHRRESPVGRVHERDGQVLLLGVGHDSNTMLHLAEVIADVPYSVEKHITVREAGRAVRLAYRETDHCCQSFDLMDGWLRPRALQAEGTVGNAKARLARARDIVAVGRAQLAQDPLVFLHPLGAGCAECDAARASIGNSHVV